MVIADHDGGHAQVQIGIGLPLGVDACKAIHQAGDDEFSGAIDDPRALGNGHRPRWADIGDLAVAHNHDRILQVARRAAPVGYIHHRAAGQNQGNGGLRIWGGLRQRVCPGRGRCQGRADQAFENIGNESHR